MTEIRNGGDWTERPAAAYALSNLWACLAVEMKEADISESRPSASTR